MTSLTPEPQDQLTARLAEVLQDAVELLRNAAYAPPLPLKDYLPQPSLLQQCLDLCAQHQSRSPEPIRTVHHLACTGGTLISKCIAALPSVQLLSEVDPLSVLLLQLKEYKPYFAPTDMVMLLLQSTRGTRQDFIVEMFRQQMRLLYQDALNHGQHLVLRDHAHSHFCTNVIVGNRPNLRELMPPDIPVLALLTVRHPLDSYASLVKFKSVHFEPKTFDEYCKRYHQFLDSHAGVAIIRYEDFVSDPEVTMQTVCSVLDLRYESHFQQLFRVFKLTGDSGRTGVNIEPRPPLETVDGLRVEANESANYARLISRLGYVSEGN